MFRYLCYTICWVKYVLVWGLDFCYKNVTNGVHTTGTENRWALYSPPFETQRIHSVHTSSLVPQSWPKDSRWKILTTFHWFQYVSNKGRSYEAIIQYCVTRRPTLLCGSLIILMNFHSGRNSSFNWHELTYIVMTDLSVFIKDFSHLLAQGLTEVWLIYTESYLTAY